MSAQNEYTIRKATESDFAAVDELVDAAYYKDYGELDTSWDDYRFAKDRACYPMDVWVVARATGEIIGTISSRIFGERAVYEETEPAEMDLRLLAVSPNARREGIGRKIMQFVAEQAKGQGFKRVLLKTDDDWEGAHKLYEGLGWRRWPARDGIIADGKLLDDTAAVICFAIDL